eukprot:Nk52_evm24s1671 gene=Nk52_evmTU24s1671
MRKPLAIPLNGAQQCVNTLLRMGNNLARRGNHEEEAGSSSGRNSDSQTSMNVLESEEMSEHMEVQYHNPAAYIDAKIQSKEERRSQTHQLKSKKSNEFKREQFHSALEAIQRTLPSDTNGLWDLLKTLKNMTENDTQMDVENRLAVGKSNAVYHISEIIRNNLENVGILELALASLRFVTKGDSYNIEQATRSGAIQLNIQVMKTHKENAEIQRYCCMVFRSLTFNRADNQRLVVEGGCMPLIIDTMIYHSNNPQVQAAAFMAIQNITWLVGENRSSVERSGGMKLILESMENHESDIDVQKWGLGALQNLACCDYCTVKLIELGALKTVLAAMKFHEDEAVLQNYGLGVFRNISYLKSNRVLVAQSGAITQAIRAMSIHINDLEVQNSACAFFFNTIIDTPENCKTVIYSEKSLEVILESSVVYKEDKTLSRKWNTLLDLFAANSSSVPNIIEPLVTKGALTLKELAGREIHHQISLSHFATCGSTAMCNEEKSVCKSKKKFGILGKWYGGFRCNDVDVMQPEQKNESAMETTAEEKAMEGIESAALQGGNHECSYRVSCGGDSPTSFVSISDHICNSYKRSLINSLVKYVERGQHCMECDGSFIDNYSALGVKSKGVWQLHIVCSPKCQKKAVERLSEPPAAA